MLGHRLYFTGALVNLIIGATTAYSFPSVLRFPPWYRPGETILGHPYLVLGVRCAHLTPDP